MKRLTTLLLLSSFAFYTSAQETTDINTIVTNIRNITSHASDLGNIAQNLTTITEALALNTASLNVQSAINVSIANAKNLPPELDVADSIKLIPEIQALSNTTVAAVDALIEHQAFFVENSLSEIVLPSLQLQNETSHELNAEITKRNPPNVQAQSEELVQPIFDALAAGIKAFENNGTGCGSVESCYEAAGVERNGSSTATGTETSGGSSLKMEMTSYGVVVVMAVIALVVNV